MTKTIVVLLGLLPFIHPSRYTRQIIRNYQHEIVYPSKNLVEGNLSFGDYPVKVSTGFHLKPLPLRFPRPPFAFPAPGNFGSKFSRPPFLSGNLFTPNTIEQPAETKGQIDEYRKALIEEAMEAEKERYGIGSRLQGTKHMNFVSVKSNGYNYTYSI